MVYDDVNKYTHKQFTDAYLLDNTEAIIIIAMEYIAGMSTQNLIIGVIAAAAFAVFEVNYVIYSSALTVYVVILLDIFGQNADTTAVARLADTAIGAADTGTRLRMRVTGVPAGGQVLAPVASMGGNAVLVSADSNGAGGTPVSGSGYRAIALSNGVGTATWEVMTTDPNAIETLLFNVILQGAVSDGIQVAGTLAPVSTAPLGPVHQTRRVKLRLDEGVAPAEIVIAQQVFVEMLHIPAKVAMTIKLQHLLDRFRRHPARRNLAQPTVEQACFPSLFVTVAVAPELPLRQAKQLACLHHRKIAAIPAAQNVPKLLHSPVL